MSEDEIYQKEAETHERQFERSLRPKSFDEFVGQDKIKKNLDVFIRAAQTRDESVDHVLLYGPSGLGKTTLAHIIALKMGSRIRTITGPSIEKSGDLASILTNMREKDILFIDEIHRMNKIIEEVLYSAMEDYALDIVVGKGPSARTLRLDLPQFTLIGATTRLGMLSTPLRNRFGALYHLEFYSHDHIQQIIEKNAERLGLQIDEGASKILSRASRRTPRVANRLLRRGRDQATMSDNKDHITEDVAQKTLEMLDIDHIGLERMDRAILEVIIDKFRGGPVGIKTISAICGEEVENIEEIYEPYLLQLGFLERTSQGRKATTFAYAHLNKELPARLDPELVG